MAEAAVTFLLEHLRQLVIYDIAELSRVLSNSEIGELQKLHDDLMLIQPMLEDLREKEGWTTSELAKEIIKFAYEAEDRIDTRIADAKTSPRSYFVRVFNTNSMHIEFNGQELRSLHDRAKMFLNDMPDIRPHEPSAQPRKQELLLKEEEDIVGFEDEAETLVRYLLDETEELDVISIVGMLGSGKTTLAWKIYNDHRIQLCYPHLIWVRVYEELNMRDTFLAILRKLSKEDMSKLPDALLADIVRNNLENQKFLMFIDGVDSTEDWRVIEAALPKANRLGKVLLTTRSREVARVASYRRRPLELRSLNLEESWELLQHQVFGRNNDICPPELEYLGKQIAEQCGGLPLAVVVIGGYLVGSSPNRRELWEKVSNSVTTYLQDDEQKRMENIISSSYNKLPHRLRYCFLYLGMFPPDTEIPAWKLTCLWIAEGFIQPDRVKSLEEVAGEYLDYLVDRNLVVVGKTKANGGVKTCRVPHMIRHFCQTEASSANQNLFQEVKMTREGVFDPTASDVVQCRRLCIHSNVIEFLARHPKGPRVRTFLCFSREPIELPAEYSHSIPEAFVLLRVLDVNSIRVFRLPSTLYRLIHLRYIALSGYIFGVLPAAVNRLWNLQTIKIDTTSHQIEIKADIWKMMQLRHLKTKAAIVLTKKVNSNGGENLQTLSRLSTQSLTNDLCDRAFNLKNLGIRGDLNSLMDTTCLARLDRLEKLKLLHDVFPRVALENPLIRLPGQTAFPPNLRILELSFTLLEWNHINTLETLPTLEVLKLKELAFVGSLWEVDDGCFPSLEALQIEHSDLEVWTASKDSFPRLRCLVLKKCEKLEGIPHGLVKSLQVVDIERVTKSVVDSARKIKEEVQAQPGARRGGFQLKISPGDESL